MSDVRAYTLKLRELVDNGTISTTQIFEELMSYLSEQDVKEFCLNGFAGEIADQFDDLEH